MIQAFIKVLFASGLVVLPESIVFAQTQSSVCPPAGKPSVVQVASLIGCPFSAVIENETSQTLVDGTRIHRKFKAMIYRDSSGRTRYESYSPADTDKDSPESLNLVFIVDPVAGYRYYVLPERASASRIGLNDSADNRKVNKQPQHSSSRESNSAETRGSKTEFVSEELGTQEMQGLLVTGRRYTYTIPAGEEGNDRPLVIVSETWTSSKMGITLLEKRSDPRSGDIEKRVTELKQTEPDPALFQVPPGYTITGE